MSDVNSELAKAKGLGVSPTTTSEGTTASSAAEDRQILLGKIREAVARLNESEAQLERTKARIGSLERKDARLLKQIDDFQKQIAELRTNIEAQQATIEEQKTTIVAQKVQIDQLGAQVETVTVKNRQLVSYVDERIDRMGPSVIEATGNLCAVIDNARTARAAGHSR